MCTKRPQQRRSSQLPQSIQCFATPSQANAFMLASTLPQVHSSSHHSSHAFTVLKELHRYSLVSCWILDPV